MADQVQQKNSMAIFGAKKQEKTANDHAARNNITSLVAADTVLTGDIKAKSGYKIDGKVIGNILIQSEKESLLHISEKAFVEGNIEAPRISILGQVKGTIRAKEIRLGASANVEGEMYYEKLYIAEGAEALGYLRKVEDEHVVELGQPYKPPVDPPANQ